MLVRLAWLFTRKLATFFELWHTEGMKAVFERARLRMDPSRYRPNSNTPSDWLAHYRPKAEQLERFRRTEWPADAPTISVLIPAYNTKAEWLTAAVESVTAQTYPHWQLVIVNDASPSPHVRPLIDKLAAGDSRVVAVHLDKNGGVSRATNAAFERATGEYVCVLDHDDVLEPQALHRVAKAVLSEGRPGLLYSDEALTWTDLTDVFAVRARPQFSHDYYLCHPYFVHLVVKKSELVRRVGGWDETLRTSHDVDLVLRVLEVTDAVTHIPDVLYRWRTHPGSLGHRTKHVATDATLKSLRGHLDRIGGGGSVRPHPTQFNVFDVRFPVAAGSKVAILIPTKNQLDFIRECVESLERTTDPALVDIVVIDHQSDDPDTRAYLNDLKAKHTVVPATGPFNFSAICNSGVRQVRGPYTHYLFLNNDTAAPEPGWVEHMLGFACRPDVGAVGATLIYPNDHVQHAGVLIGVSDLADHAFRFTKFAKNHYEREMGDNCGLLCNRDYMAVTAACVLVRADVFHQIGGFDEQLAVGFNDTDLCLRIIAAGYRVLNDAHAVLLHFESQTRGVQDKHPNDSARFRSRYAHLIETGDPYFSPLLELHPLMNRLNINVTCPDEVAPRTVKVKLGDGRVGAEPVPIRMFPPPADKVA
jgi:GT2 family glycosyltransferase